MIFEHSNGQMASEVYQELFSEFFLAENNVHCYAITDPRKLQNWLYVSFVYNPLLNIFVILESLFSTIETIIIQNHKGMGQVDLNPGDIRVINKIFEDLCEMIMSFGSTSLIKNGRLRPPANQSVVYLYDYLQFCDSNELYCLNLLLSVKSTRVNRLRFIQITECFQVCDDYNDIQTMYQRNYDAVNGGRLFKNGQRKQIINENWLSKFAVFARAHGTTYKKHIDIDITYVTRITDYTQHALTEYKKLFRVPLFEDVNRYFQNRHAYNMQVMVDMAKQSDSNNRSNNLECTVASRNVFYQSSATNRHLEVILKMVGLDCSCILHTCFQVSVLDEVIAADRTDRIVRAAHNFWITFENKNQSLFRLGRGEYFYSNYIDNNVINCELNMLAVAAKFHHSKYIMVHSSTVLSKLSDQRHQNVMVTFFTLVFAAIIADELTRLANSATPSANIADQPTYRKKRLSFVVNTNQDVTDSVLQAANYIYNVECFYKKIPALLVADDARACNAEGRVGFNMHLAFPGCSVLQCHTSEHSALFKVLPFTNAMLLINPFHIDIPFCDIDLNKIFVLQAHSFILVRGDMRFIQCSNYTCDTLAWFSVNLVSIDVEISRLTTQSHSSSTNDCRRRLVNSSTTSCLFPCSVRNYRCTGCDREDFRHYPYCKDCLTMATSLVYKQKSVSDQTGTTIVDGLYSAKNIKATKLIFSEKITNDFFELLDMAEADIRRTSAYKKWDTNLVPMTIEGLSRQYMVDQTYCRGLSGSIQRAADHQVPNCIIRFRMSNGNIFADCVALVSISESEELLINCD